jgi:hypothetical protein
MIMACTVPERFMLEADDKIAALEYDNEMLKKENDEQSIEILRLHNLLVNISKEAEKL